MPLQCSDIQPCLTQFIEAFHAPNFKCSCATMPTSDPTYFICGPGVTGTCNDPLKPPARGIPIFTSQAAADPGDPGGGMAVRMTFSKVLSNSIESVMPSGSTTPGATLMYTLAPNTIKVTDPKGNEVPATSPVGKYLDNAGPPSLNNVTPSDLIQVPGGAAIVWKPDGQLDPKTTYTIQLNTSGIKDREGNAAADANGQPLPGTFMTTFTTEDITRRTATSFPTSFGSAAMPTAIKPNEILKFAFWSTMDPATVKNLVLTGPAGETVANLEIFQSKGSDPTGMTDPTMACKAGSMTGPTQSVRIAHVSAPGMPTDWTPGTYTISFTIQDKNHVSTYSTSTLSDPTCTTPATCKPITFAVMAPDADTTMDANTIFQKKGDIGQVLPEQCSGM
jgi:hypothetical protein